MKQLVPAIALLLVLGAVSCSKNKEHSETVPPGFCGTEAECQPMADRQNNYQDQLRRKLIGQGVHEQYLPCGKYQGTQAANGFWQVTRDATGCPATASQQDPHPDFGKANQLKR